ncbi:MAG: flagellin [Gammaproteobacteria bacterium]|nr:flagellin [Gammaproteobacteria bacterium]
MSLVINTNVMSLDAQKNLTKSGNALATSLQRLSSGMRINSAKDDAAGLAIADRFTSQINGLNQAAANANDGISLAQTGEGALQEVTNNLQRIRELSVQSLNATNSASDRQALDAEVQQLKAEIDRVAQTTNFNGVKLLDGSFSSQTFQVGANQGETISVSAISSARTSALGQSYGASQIGTQLTAATGITAAGQFTINATDVFSGSTIAGNARDIAAAINSKGITGVTATAGATTAAGAYTATASITAGTATLTINGIAIGLNLSGVGPTDVANTLSAINNNSAATGVTATNNGGAITLTASDGRNITTAFALGTATNAALQDVGLGTVNATSYGSYSLQYTGTSQLVIAGSAAAGVKGQASITLASQATGTAISNVDVTNVTNANATLTSVDAALRQIDSSRAALGAYQNRFQSAINSIQTTSTNLTASRSRIQDTDFAAETANLTRAQILQQAGTAMIAQANSAPQQVLSLLKNL